MARSKVKEIERLLEQTVGGYNFDLTREYYASHVEIGFWGDEIINFVIFNERNQLFKCYNIETTIKGLEKIEKKSWRGNYNYLVVPESLMQKVNLNDLKNRLPNYVGIIVVDDRIINRESIQRAKMVEISEKDKTVLRDGLIRTLFYKVQRPDS